MTSTETAAQPAQAEPTGTRYRPLAGLILAQLVVGVLLGLIWLGWSPHSVAYNLDLGSGKGVIVPGEGESLIAADGRFVILTAVPGLVFGYLAWRLRALRGRLTVLALVLSSLAASGLTKYTGQLLSGGHHSAAINTAFRPHLSLHANAALFLQALLAALVYTSFVGLTGDPELGRPSLTDALPPEAGAYPPPQPANYPPPQPANYLPPADYPPPEADRNPRPSAG